MMKQFLLISLVLGLGLNFGLYSDLHALPRKAAKPKAADCDTNLSSDSSVIQGILKHGEHWADLVLTQGGGEDPRPTQALLETAKDLMTRIESGSSGILNEKIDGSPSIVFGYDKSGEAFVAYKREIGKKSGQKLVYSAADAAEAYGRSEALVKIFSSLADSVLPVLKASKTKATESLLFQADLLFYPGAPELTQSETEVSFTPNTLTYSLKPGAADFEKAKSAKVGMAVHTVAKRTEVDGVLDAGNYDLEKGAVALDKLAALFQKSPDVFFTGPLKGPIALSKSASLNKSEIEKALKEVEAALSKLSPEFRSEWGAGGPKSGHQGRFRIFFNRYLRAPFDGGFYKVAQEGKPLDYERLLSEFSQWLTERAATKPDGKVGTETQSYVKTAEAFLKERKAELKSFLEAYFKAVWVQHQISLVMEEALASKLGGGPSEGLMLKTGETIVKWVDRMDFTVQNNINNRPQKKSQGADATLGLEPFSTFVPGAAYILMKGQPLHKGHIAMIKAAAEALKSSGKPIYLLLSTKEPNLRASKWNELGLLKTKTLAEARAKNYTYPLSKKTREKIVALASLPKDVSVNFVETVELWRFLDRFQSESGKVKLIVGEKEVSEDRYGSMLEKYGNTLELFPVEMKEDGLSATQLRLLMKNYWLGTKKEQTDAKSALLDAYAFIADDAAREELVDQMLSEWKQADDAMTALLPAEKAPKPESGTPKKPKK